MPGDCILLSTDLMLASQFSGAAQRTHRSTVTVGSEHKLWDALTDQCASLVVIDLTTPAVSLPEIVGKLKALESPPTILAFGPHVQEARLDAARRAGCDRVLTRGQFHAQMEAILRAL